MTTATPSVLIDQIFNRSSIMQETNNDVQACNTTLRKLQNAFYTTKWGQFDELVLLKRLVKSYQECKDDKFVAYIKHKRSDRYFCITSPEIVEFTLN
jgi:hypothetical protein